MKSAYELLTLFISIYLGIFTFIGYEIIFKYQKKYLFIKHIAYFIFIAIIWIRFTDKYHLKLNIYYAIGYIIGLVVGIIFFKKDIDEKVIKNEGVINILYLITNTLLFSPLIKKIKCIFTEYKLTRKYPFLKKKSSNELF